MLTQLCEGEHGGVHVVVVVGPMNATELHRIMVEGSNNRFYAQRPMLSPHLTEIRAR